MHRPVLLEETISSLNLKQGDIVLDATVGGGGHAREILKRIIPGGMLIGLDADPAAIEKADGELGDFRPHFKLINENFRNMDRVLTKEGVGNLDAVLFDIGVSSFQLDDNARSFSMKSDSALDMRMDPRLDLTAHTIVNKYRERDLSDLIKRYGEERFHGRVARGIIEARSRKEIRTARDLTEIIHKAVGFRYKRSRIDPATRTFQALRIAVNDELGALEEGLKKSLEWLRPGSRICVISFHSLEDRIVKNLFKGFSVLGILKIITKKPVRPSAEEAAENPRSRSGRLRVAERV